ncbi:hypothetical protein DPMN_016951, partial [Dreissena polymorpha]
MAALDSLTELNNLLEEWNTENNAAGFAVSDPVPKLKRLAEIFENETEAYYKMDPDPFDDRHPGRANPTCSLGHLFKALFKNEEFMNRMVCEYLVDPHGNNNLVAVAGRLLLAVLPAVEKRDVFVDTLVNSYVLHAERNVAIQTLACRLLYDILPGLETAVVFQETEGLVDKLLEWAEKADEPLRSYATGLLAGAMELQDVASNNKEKNSRLVSLLLQRLHELQKEMHAEYLKTEAGKQEDHNRHFPVCDGSPNKSITADGFVSPTKIAYSRSPGRAEMISSPFKKSPARSDGVKEEVILVTQSDKCNGIESDKSVVQSPKATDFDGGQTGLELKESNDSKNKPDNIASISETACCSNKMDQVNAEIRLVEKSSANGDLIDSESDGEVKSEGITVEERKARIKRTLSPSYYSEDVYRFKRQRVREDSFMLSDVSNSSWAEIQPYVIGSYSLEPMTLGMKQRMILQYLTPMGEYQELISLAFEHRAMDLVFYYINLKYNRDVRLAFEALKYLAVLLCHKKFAIEFLNHGGVQKLLNVYRPSIAATGVSLCLYYLSYFEDAMERVCLLSDHLLTTLVNYVLWLMECSHVSSRCHAAMFFLQSFPFLVILNRFDTHDGLRRLYNTLSTLEIMNIESNASLTEDQMFTQRQSARHVCVALKKYFECHLVLKVNELKRSHARSEGGSPHHETPAYKSLKLTPELVQDCMELMMEMMPVRQQWTPEATFFKLGGISLLTQLVAMSHDWPSYTGKPETIRAALDVISLCCVTPRSQLQLLQSVPLPENVVTPAISVFIGMSEGDNVQDPEVQRSALSIIINCVCGPLERLGGGVGRYMGSGARKKVNWKVGEDVLSKMWNGVRENNGIMVLLKLLTLKTPITDADSIRAMACKALVGMARSETVRQIISKLPIISSGQLQSLMKEPVLQDKRQEHVKFCRYATQLVEKVSGNQTHRYSNASLDDIRKADIVAQSKIIFQEKELLQLIHDHLQSKGYHDSAEVLQREAGLAGCVTPPPGGPGPAPHLFTPVHTASPPSHYTSVQVGLLTPRPLHRPLSQQLAFPHSGSTASHTNTQSSSHPAPSGQQTGTQHHPNQQAENQSNLHSLSQTSPGKQLNISHSQPQQLTENQSNISSSQQQLTGNQSNIPATASSAPNQSTGSGPQQLLPASNQSTLQHVHPAGQQSNSTPQTPGGPIRFSISRQGQASNTPTISHTALRAPATQQRCRYVKERDPVLFSPAIKREMMQRTHTEYEISLDKIITEYLRKQHALCRNPVVTCPPMSLFHPHRCPEPRCRQSAPLSFTARTLRRLIHPRFGGPDGCKLDRKFIYSRFRPLRTYKDTEDDGFSCCTFANLQTSQQYLMIGTYGGNLRLVNTQSAEETGSFHCHSSPVTHCEHSKDGKLVLTASSYGIMYSSALWSWGSETLDNKFNFEDHHLEFSRHIQDRLIGTKDETAHIYDLTTGQMVVKLYDADKANNYKANRAIFNPTDELVLNDGVLWDVRSAKAIHKFDKFNQYVSGVFHPVGLEIIINSEIWDIRSFRLLHTVPELDQCQIRFNHRGDVMYATRIDEELDTETERHSPYGSIFRTLDTTNYSLIATVDVKSRSITDISTDKMDSYLAVVE